MTAGAVSYASQRDAWYGRLAREGFRDIERGGHLVRGVPRARRGRVEVDAIAEYYRLATAWLEGACAPRGRDRAIWERHADGQTVRAIVRALRVSSRDVVAVVARERQRMLAAARESAGDNDER
jgi:hypothetical protein